jgi:hypothetical protein
MCSCSKVTEFAPTSPPPPSPLLGPLCFFSSPASCMSVFAVLGSGDLRSLSPYLRVAYVPAGYVLASDRCQACYWRLRMPPQPSMHFRLARATSSGHCFRHIWSSNGQRSSRAALCLLCCSLLLSPTPRPPRRICGRTDCPSPLHTK